MSKAFKKYLAATPLALLLIAGCDGVPKYEFDLTPLAADGSVYKGSGHFKDQPWSCVRDNKTGLTWEVKTDSAGLHAAANTYTWYNRDDKTNGGAEGKANGGMCTGSGCDTEAFVAAVNSERLCGYSDWRLPSKDELSSLIDVTVRIPGPTLPTKFFPNTQNTKSGYWTATVFHMHNGSAWTWRFDQGADMAALKDEPRYVRLVHGVAAAQNQNPKKI